MTKTCIVCGGPASSGEHVFPASLGGRRTNKGIYCSIDDNSYSGLVHEISEQLDFVNAYLGVHPDHSKALKTARAELARTGETVSISADQIKFTKPRIISRTPVGDGEAVQFSFPDQQSVKQFIKKLEATGHQVTLQSKPFSRPYVTGTIHHKRIFGGACALGAVAYMAQTFFAQEFPDIARSGVLSDFINYTQAIAKLASLGGCKQKTEESERLINSRATLMAALAPFDGVPPVWWDFTQTNDVYPNKFEFGHRVTVGVNGSDNQIYGRVALFSTLNFAMRLGTAPRGSATREVTVEINPLAKHPPNDIERREAFSAPSGVDVPTHPTKYLEEAIANGAQVLAFNRLLERLAEYQLVNLARSMGATLAQCATMPQLEAQALIKNVLSEQPQQIWRMVTSVIEGLKEVMIKGNKPEVAQLLDSLAAHDCQTFSGLSQRAEAVLNLAMEALGAQIEMDCVAGTLSEARIAELIGRGPGLHIVGQAICAQVLLALGTVE